MTEESKQSRARELAEHIVSHLRNVAEEWELLMNPTEQEQAINDIVPILEATFEKTGIKYDDACLLSRIFNAHADLSNPQHFRINEELKKIIRSSQKQPASAPEPLGTCDLDQIPHTKDYICSKFPADINMKCINWRPL